MLLLLPPGVKCLFWYKIHSAYEQDTSLLQHIIGCVIFLVTMLWMTVLWDHGTWVQNKKRAAQTWPVRRQLLNCDCRTHSKSWQNHKFTSSVIHLHEFLTFICISKNFTALQKIVTYKLVIHRFCLGCILKRHSQNSKNVTAINFFSAKT